MSAPTIRYEYRGSIERATKRGYAWRAGYSETADNGAVAYPWQTKRECQRDAAARGARAVFVRDSDIGAQS